MRDYRLIPEDLAPGDQSSAAFDFSAVEVHRIASVEDPLFEEAYGALWKYFGASNEMESKEVLARRFALNRHAAGASPSIWYDLVLFRTNQGPAAVCDHTAVADHDGVVVHVSHILIEPEWRRTGLAGWIRALPIQSARTCITQAGLPCDLPITLVAGSGTRRRESRTDRPAEVFRTGGLSENRSHRDRL